MTSQNIAPCDNKHMKKYTSNLDDGPNVEQSDQTALKDCPQPCRDDHMIYHLDSCSETELKEQFVSDLERIGSFVKQIEARELELVQVEEAEYRKTGNCCDKSSNIAGRKRTMPVPPDRETTRKPLLKTMELSSTETRKFCKEAAKNTVSRQKRTVPKAKENPRTRREMSDRERVQIGIVLQDFSAEYMDEILQIVAKRNSQMVKPDGDGEIELDVHALDRETMWDLLKFVKLNLKARQSNKFVKSSNSSSSSSETDSSSGKEYEFKRLADLY